MRPADLTLGQLLQRHRQRAGLTQRDLADRSGVSVRTIGHLEQDRVRRPRTRSLDALAEALGVTSRALLATPDPPAGTPPVRIKVLGPLELRRDGVPVEIVPAKQRRLLCLLALRAGQVVPRHEIVGALWDGRPPASSHNLVHTYVAALRRLLEPEGSDTREVLLTSAEGYRLALGPDGSDLLDFERLVAQARDALSDGLTARALPLLAQALQCWRGPVLGGVDATLAQHPAAVAAAARRVETAVAYADAAFRLRRHDRLVGLLRQVAQDEPLHERVHARLIRALAADGQQAAAVELYQRVRRRLADGLGIEPTVELSGAYLDVLRACPVPEQDPEPAEPEPTGPLPPHRPEAMQIPGDVAGFAGRRAELAALDAPSARIVVVSGTAGVGKTSLVVHWAHRVRDRFPDGQLYVNLRGFDPAGAPMPPAEAVRGFLDALGVSPQRLPAGVDAQTAMYRSLLADRRVLVVLDNAHDAEQVRPLLPGTPGCLAVVTSRNPLTGLVATQGARSLTLDLLTREEANQLLAQRLGAQRVRAEAAGADTIVDFCARLPLALAVAAARAIVDPDRPLAELARELGAHRRLDTLDGGDPSSNVRVVFSCSYRTLQPAAAELFRLLGLHPGPDAGEAAIASLAAVPVERARALLAELARAHLVGEATPRRYGFHDLLREYAAEQPFPDAAAGAGSSRRAATARILDHYLRSAHAAARVLDSDRDSPDPSPAVDGVVPEEFADAQQAIAWVNAERAVLTRAVGAAGDAGFDVHAWQLASVLAGLFERCGHWHDWVVTQRAALAVVRRSGDAGREAAAHRVLGRAYVVVGDFGEGARHFRRALELFDRQGDDVGRARTHHNLAGLFERQGRFADALSHAEQALELCRAAGHRVGQASALGAVGWFRARLGDHRRSLAYSRRALELFQELQMRHGEAATWDSIGYAYHHLGEHTDAAICYSRAVDLYRVAGDRYEEAASLRKLGDLHRDAGDLGAARTAWRHALGIFADIEKPDADEVRAALAAIDRTGRS
jgi:DNA-binding SARP family transcriptional activator/tetratricopeptide (TPR) repeat protein